MILLSPSPVFLMNRDSLSYIKRRDVMQRKPFLFAVALLAVLLSILLVTTSGSHALAHNTTIIDAPTATPDPNQILNQANQATSEAQGTLNVITSILNLFSVVVGISAIAVGLITTFGLTLLNRYRKQLSEEREEAIKRRTAMDNTLKAVVYLGLGDQLYNHDRKQEAVAFYRKVGSLLPEDSEINNSLGRIYSGTGYYDDAITAFKAALSVTSNFAEAEMELGLAYRRRGEAQKGPDAETLRNADYDEALVHLKRAIDLRPNYEDARKYYAQAQIADPSSSYALGNVASLSWYLGEKNDAKRYFILAEAAAKVRILNAGRTPEIYWDYYDQALAQLVLGEINNSKAMKDEALQTYAAATRLTPGIIQLNSVLNNLNLLQKAQEHIDRLDTAIAMLEEAKTQ